MADVKATANCWVRNFDGETVTPVDGVLNGAIPDWLEGTLIRNGSGIYQIGATMMNHLFDGMSVLHRFSIRQGKATYHNRILQSGTYLDSKAANRLTMMQFGTFAYPDPCKSVLGRFMARFEIPSPDITTDNCSVNVGYFGDKLYAMTETSLMREIDPESLDTIGDRLNLKDYVAVNHATAHPHVSEDGTVYNMGNTIGSQGPKYNIIEFPAGENAFTAAKIVVTFPSRWKMSPSYYHSFAVTDNFFIFIEYPLVLSSLKMLTANFRQQAVDAALEWYPKENARFLLAERRTGKILDQIYEAPAFFCFHTGNAYEIEGQIVLDLSYCKDAKLFQDLSLKNLRDNKGDFTNTYYTRFVIPLNVQPPTDSSLYGVNLVSIKGSQCKSYWSTNKTIMCLPERLCDQSLELPRINYQRNGKRYRFVYGIGQRDGYSDPDKVLKLDVENREVKEWSKAGFSPSEPVYVARPGSTEEDDGVVLFSALDVNDPRKVLLVIVNAASFEEVAVAEFTASGTVTKDFHGMFSYDKARIHRY